MTVKFSGETNWDALVNHNSLDIEEEKAFEEYIENFHYSKEESLETLDILYKQFCESIKES